MKRCGKCGEEKPLEEFHRNPKSPDGRQWDCKPCKLEYQRKRHATNPELGRERSRKWREDNPGATRRMSLRRLYGITEADYNWMMMDQQGVCAICFGESEPLHVDHDHVTNKVRGLLCRSCNQGIGALREDMFNLQSAIQYLHANV